MGKKSSFIISFMILFLILLTGCNITIRPICGDGSCDPVEKTLDNCPQDCAPAIPIPIEEPTCTDSDGGENYYEDGITNSSNGVASDYCNSFLGICPSASGCGEGPYLVEWICDESSDSGYSPIFYECPNECNDGACLNENTAPSNATMLLSLDEPVTLEYEDEIHSLEITGHNETIIPGSPEDYVAHISVNSSASIWPNIKSMKAGQTKTISGLEVYVSHIYINDSIDYVYANLVINNEINSTVALNDPQNIVIGNETYTLNIIGANSGGISWYQVHLRVDDTTVSMEEGERQVISGLPILVQDFFITTIGVYNVEVNVLIGS